ncbi:hypothetical protein PLIIFM63780_002100 [Purpureocillium lilacinum]|nr:hypothetical protein PLIIFM63780_002100 [Purpureocillium lilacinum]
MACQRCRRKRAKCDGEDPCQRCKDAGLECAFDHSRRESKDDLRAEIERLRRIGERNEALLDALSSMDDTDTYNTVAQRLMDSTVTRDSIYNDLPNHQKARGEPVPTPAAVIAPSSRRNSPATSSAAASSSNIRPVTCPHCHGILALYQVSCGREAEARELAEAFKAEMTKLCLREPFEAGKQDDQYMQYGWADGSNTGTLAGESRSQLTSVQLVPAKIFQLTEWVYKLLVRSPAATGDEVVLVYQAYVDTFGLRTVSPLMPYFVCASGLLSLAVEEPGHGILDAVPIPQHGHNDGCLAKTTESPQETIKKEPDDDPVDLESHYGHKSSGEQHNRPSPQPMPIKMPIVTHARLLLSKMSFGYSAAFLADGMLHRAPGSN